MRILLLNQFFWPDSAATSQLLTDVARELADRGHEVHVICAEPGYALEDTSEKPRVELHRVKSMRFVRGPAARLASYGSFYLASLWKIMRVRRPDVVVTLTTPPLLPLLGAVAKAFRGSQHFIWEMDMYPDVAVDLGYLRKAGFLDCAIGILADFARRRCDGILALGVCMQERLIQRGVSRSKIHITENWADSLQIRPVPWPDESAPLTVLYSGNFGLAHDAATIESAIAQMRNDRTVRFIFAGGGARKKALEAACLEKDLSNVEFRSYSNKANLAESLGSGHIGLITQQNACLGSVVPSKVYGLMAAGRPILYIGPSQSTIAGIIRQFHCGWQVDCGDTEILLSLLGRLNRNRGEIELAGRQARIALLEHYDRHRGVSRVCEALKVSDQPGADEQVNLNYGSTVAEEKEFAKSL